MFSAQLAEFQRSLEKASPSPTVANLAADYGLFKNFVATSLAHLQRQADLLAQECDRLEMRSRMKIALIHGVPEVEGEDAVATVLQLASERMRLTLASEAIRRSHRFGRGSGSKPRPILVKFATTADRDKFWFAKTALKGSGVTVSEFLTKMRHDTFLEARKRLGVTKCWTRNGVIVVLAADGSHHRITTMDELMKVAPQSSQAQISVAVSARGSQDANTTKSKRVKK